MASPGDDTQVENDRRLHENLKRALAQQDHDSLPAQISDLLAQLERQDSARKTN